MIVFNNHYGTRRAEIAHRFRPRHHGTARQPLCAATRTCGATVTAGNHRGVCGT